MQHGRYKKIASTPIVPHLLSNVFLLKRYWLHYQNTTPFQIKANAISFVWARFYKYFPQKTKHCQPSSTCTDNQHMGLDSDERTVKNVGWRKVRYLSPNLIRNALFEVQCFYPILLWDQRLPKLEFRNVSTTLLLHSIHTIRSSSLYTVPFTAPICLLINQLPAPLFLLSGYNQSLSWYWSLDNAIHLPEVTDNSLHDPLN